MSTGWYAPHARYNGIDSRPRATDTFGSGIHNTCPCPFSSPLKLSPASAGRPAQAGHPQSKRRRVERVIPTRQRAGVSLLPIKQFFYPLQIRYATGNCFMGFCPLPKLLQGLGTLGQGT